MTFENCIVRKFIGIRYESVGFTSVDVKSDGHAGVRLVRSAGGSGVACARQRFVADATPGVLVLLVTSTIQRAAAPLLKMGSYFLVYSMFIHFINKK